MVIPGGGGGGGGSSGSFGGGGGGGGGPCGLPERSFEAIVSNLSVFIHTYVYITVLSLNDQSIV